MSIRSRLAFFIVVMVVLVGLMAGAGYRSLATFERTLAVIGQESDDIQHAQDAIGDASLALKTQVQEWKNLLLRGHDPAARAKYAKEFRARAEEVERNLERLDRLAAKVSLDQAHLTEAHQGLKTLTEAYEQALAAWKEGDDLAYRAADAAVKGKDRSVSKAIEVLHEAVDRQMDAMQARAVTDGAAAGSEGRSTLLTIAGGIALLATVLGGIIAYLIRAPLERQRAALVRLAAHDYHQPVPDQDRSDEAGQMAVALERLRLGLEAEHEVTRALRERIQELTQAAEGLAHTGATLTEAATISNRQAASVVDASRDTSANVSSVAAAAAEEMSASIAEISGNSARAVEVVQKAVDDARRAAQAVDELAKANDAIGNVAQSIADIAARTNLLALNASIEAASAGEAGRGFAVVAGEVKALARQTAESTEDITGRLAGVRESVHLVVEAIQRTTVAIEEISGLQQAIAGALQAQTEVTGDIGRTIIQVSSSTHDISTAIAEVSTSASTTETSAKATGAAAEQLKRLAGEFNALAGRLAAGANSSSA